jgi:hypothetical protein
MASPEAGAIKIITIPRLPIGRLCELRRFLDQTMIGLSSEDRNPTGGCKHGEMQSSPEEPVRESATSGRVAGTATAECIAAARIAVDRSSRNTKRMRGLPKAKGGRR